MNGTISRDAAINKIEQAKVRISHSIERAIGRSIIEILDDVEKNIRGLPSAEPKRIRGKWIYCEDSTADCVDGYRCDQCGFFVPWDYKHKGIDFIHDYNFCPHCGAKMEGTT